ncbi:MAG TPA: tetratricopeptide repeat protein [Actinomadura sp.]|jgi:tetratricopeptide (TPR) repeat protein|nr:tetratricopeptide repeat protein [Actinomadura sp.]
MSATSNEAATDPRSRCEEARRLAESGDLGGAARVFEEVLALGDIPERGRAALGLAVVLEDSGDLEGARAADLTAIETEDREYGARAAYHLALGHERAGARDEAGRAWRIVADFGNPSYLPPAYLALARLADDEGDAAAAGEWWERVIQTGDEEYAPVAAHDLAERLLERGESARAQRVLADALRLMDRETAPYAYARLAVAIGIAHLDQAIGAFGAVVEADGGDPEIGSLAIELLARVLPLRGRGEEAHEVWSRGLSDPVLAGQVRARLRRDLPVSRNEDETPDETPGGRSWWEPHVESAICSGALPALTGEAFGALDQMYALIAMRYAEGAEEPPAEAHEALGRAVRVPGEFPWGRALHDSFAERLRVPRGAAAPEPRERPGPSAG